MKQVHPLIAHIESIVPLTDAEAEKVLQAFYPKLLKKREILLFKGDISSHMRFIESGSLRSYYIDAAAQERILQFGIKGWWINDLYSYLTQTPAEYFIQAVEASMVLQIHRDSLEALFQQVPAMERFFRIKIQRAYVALQERTMRTLSQSAEQRYIEFRQKYREIEQRVPQYMIASYLGITPEHLSTIRKGLLS